MKSDLEIENAASLTLRRSLVGRNPAWSITGAFRQLALSRESFTATFRKATGLTPRGFRRSLD